MLKGVKSETWNAARQRRLWNHSFYKMKALVIDKISRICMLDLLFEVCPAFP